MNIDIGKIVNYLKGISVSEKYEWNIPFEKGHGSAIFSEKDNKSFIGLTNFEKNVRLKTVVSDKVIDAFKRNDIKYLKQIFEWIVHDWGGISGGRGKIDELYKMGIEAIEKGNLSFERIASISKILSFYNPSEHMIYDSRIAYSLNTIMLFVDASKKYFPVPAGKNTRMNAFDIEVLIRLKHKPKEYRRQGSKNLISNADKTLFFEKEEAYLIINDTIKKINKEFYKNVPDKQNKPFYTEMLLFAIADTIIYDKILESVQIKIEK